MLTKFRWVSMPISRLKSFNWGIAGLVPQSAKMANIQRTIWSPKWSPGVEIEGNALRLGECEATLESLGTYAVPRAQLLLNSLAVNT